MTRKAAAPGPGARTCLVVSSSRLTLLTYCFHHRGRVWPASRQVFGEWSLGVFRLDRAFNVRLYSRRSGSGSPRIDWTHNRRADRHHQRAGHTSSVEACFFRATLPTAAGHGLVCSPSSRLRILFASVRRTTSRFSGRRSEGRLVGPRSSCSVSTVGVAPDPQWPATFGCASRWM